MPRSTSFHLMKVQQPSEAAWQRALDFAEQWNRASPAHRLEPSLDLFLDARDVPADHPEHAALRRAFAELARHGVVGLEVVNETVDAAALAAADFVHIIGVGIPERPDRPFVSGGDFRNLGPCPRCGVDAGWRWEQRAPFVVDESQLRARAHTLDGEREPGPDGWDIVNLPNGGVAVSRRFVDVLRESGLGGWREREILSAATGEPSTKLAQLEATTMLLLPCRLHDDSEATRVCPVCGVVLEGRLEMGWHVQRALVDGLALFSRGPTPGHSLYLRRVVYERMRERGCEGLIPLHTARICDHAPPANS